MGQIVAERLVKGKVYCDMSKMKNAVLFAAAGELSTAVAYALARRGYRLFLSARDPLRLERLAASLNKQTKVETYVVDATNESQVDNFLTLLARRRIGIDAVFNGIGPRVEAAKYGVRSCDLDVATFVETLRLVVGSQFLTATKVAPLMIKRGRGTIVLLTSSLARSATPHMAGITAASDAIEGLARVLEAEFAPLGVRVLCMRVDAIPSTRTIRETLVTNARSAGVTPEAYAERVFARSLSGSPLTLADASAAIAALIDNVGNAIHAQPIDIRNP